MSKVVAEAQNDESVESIENMLLKHATECDDVKKETVRSLVVFDKNDYKTKAAIGREALVQQKALSKALQIGSDTITRVATERDTYKDMLGEAANCSAVNDAIENKILKQTRNTKNRILIQELNKTIEQSKAICKK